MRVSLRVHFLVVSEEPYFGLLDADGGDKPSAPVVRAYAKASCN